MYFNDRTGITAIVPKLPKAIYRKSIADSSFKVIAPKLWNTLPKHVTLEESLVTFKVSLGKFLDRFPDTPPVKNYTTGNSNSIIDWVKEKTSLKLPGGQLLAR